MLLSIIIPFYNGSPAQLRRCVDSIATSGVNPADLELIIVDDCATDRRALEPLEITPPRFNTLIIRHQQNKRQGGARNTGVEAARGRWIAYIDQDDYFCPDGIRRIMEEATNHPDHDLLMCDYVLRQEETGATISEGHYTARNATGTVSGPEYIRTREIPWTPWCTLYSASFLRRTGLRFEENVRFEDSDYVIRAIVTASRLCFVPVQLVCHTVSATQQTAVGDNPEAITDLFKMSERVKNIAIPYMESDPILVNVILSHHWFMHKYDILRYLWRLPAGRILDILRRYRAFTPSPHRWLDLTSRHAITSALLITAAKPLLPLMRKLYLLKKPTFRSSSSQ